MPNVLIDEFGFAYALEPEIDLVDAIEAFIAACEALAATVEDLRRPVVEPDPRD